MEKPFDFDHFDRDQILKQSTLKSSWIDNKKNTIVLEFADGEKTEISMSSLIDERFTLDVMIGENAYNRHDNFVDGTGIICGHTKDNRMYVIGYDDEFGDIKELNLEKVYIDEECAKNCKTFKLSHPDDTIKFG